MMRKVLPLLVATCFLAACTDPEPVPDARPTSVSSTDEKKERAKPKRVDRATEALLYVRAATLRAYDLDSGQESVITSLFSDDVALSPDGSRFAVVRDRAPGTDPEGFGDPEILIGSIDTGDYVQLGRGRSPLWSQNGTQIAAITDEGVVIHDVPAGDEVLVLEGEGWALVGWTDDGVAAVGPEGVAIGASGADPTFLRMPPADLWGVSPAQQLALSVDGPALVDLASNETRAIELPEALGDGAWAPDGSAVAVVELRGRTQLVLMDAASGTVQEVPEGGGAQGGVVWSSDSQRFTFARIHPDDRFQLQAVVCTKTLECDPGFSWARGVRLLGFSTLTR